MTRQFSLALVGGDLGLQKVVSGLLPKNCELQILSSIIDAPAALQNCDILLVAEVTPECDGLELLRIFQERGEEAAAIWFIAADNSLRERAFTLKTDEYFTLPLGREFLEKLSKTETLTESTALSGTGEAVSLFSLLQLANSSLLSGNFRVESGEGVGEIALEQGQIVDAKIGLESGEEALYSLLRLAETGFKFEFVMGLEITSRTIQQRTDHLLLTIASRIDEGK
jgi:CheY-like chemotaxis protein